MNRKTPRQPPPTPAEETLTIAVRTQAQFGDTVHVRCHPDERKDLLRYAAQHRLSLVFTDDL